MIIVKWGIPDVPSDLRDRIRREAYITNEIIIKQETLRARSSKTGTERYLQATLNFLWIFCSQITSVNQRYISRYLRMSSNSRSVGQTD